MRLSERKYIRTPCLYVPCLVLKLTYAYDLCQLFFLKKRAMYGLWIWVKILSAVIYTVEYVLFTLSLRCIVELLHILNITGISNFLKKIVMINWICCKLLFIEWCIPLCQRCTCSICAPSSMFDIDKVLDTPFIVISSKKYAYVSLSKLEYI